MIVNRQYFTIHFIQDLHTDTCIGTIVSLGRGGMCLLIHL